MPVFPKQMYEREFITYFDNQQNTFLNISEDNGTVRLGVIQKSALSAINFLGRFLIWLGYSSCSIAQVSNFINSSLGNIGDRHKFVQKLVKNKTSEQIENLANNLLNLNRKIIAHNKKLWYGSLRRSGTTIEERVINDLFFYATKVKPSTPPPPNLLHRIINYVAPAKAAPAPDREAELMPLTAPTQRAPCGIPQRGNTCHLNTTINFLAGLSPVVDALQKSYPNTRAARAFKAAAIPVLKHQATQSAQPGHTQLPDAMLDKFIDKSWIGVRKEQKDRGEQRAQQDAHEDAVFILEHLDNKDATPSISHSITKQICFREYISSPCSAEPPTNTTPAKQKEWRKNISEATQIDLTSQDLQAMKPFSYNSKVNGLDVDSRNHCMSLAVMDSSGRNINRFEDALDHSLQAINEGRKNIVRTKDGKYFEVRGTARQTGRLKDAPEVLMVHYKRLVDGSGIGQRIKYSHQIETPEKPWISGKYFADGKDKEYVLCTMGIHEGKAGGGHYFACVKRQGKWFSVSDSAVRELTPSEMRTQRNQGYMYGYVRRDIYELTRRKSVPAT